jgi:hypothetical protein
VGGRELVAAGAETPRCCCWPPPTRTTSARGASPSRGTTGATGVAKRPAAKSAHGASKWGDASSDARRCAPGSHQARHLPRPLPAAAGVAWRAVPASATSRSWCRSGRPCRCGRVRREQQLWLDARRLAVGHSDGAS